MHNMDFYFDEKATLQLMMTQKTMIWLQQLLVSSKFV